MAELPLQKPAGILIKTTCVDYPGMLAVSFFLKGCNLRCPYCYNKELVLNTKNTDYNSIQELFEHLEKRKDVIKGFVLSGGEPLLNPWTEIIIRKAKESGYKVKLDTNGTLPEKLAVLLSDSQLKPDFIAMDIKTSPDRYESTLCIKNCNNQNICEKIRESVNLISELPAQNREFRTVLVPSLIDKADIRKIAEILPSDASWQFAQFKNENCLNSDYNRIIPYSDAELNELVNYAKNFINGACLR